MVWVRGLGGSAAVGATADGSLAGGKIPLRHASANLDVWSERSVRALPDVWQDCFELELFRGHVQ